MNPLAGAIGLTDFYHVGMVVSDLNAAVRRFDERVGIGRWASMVLPGRFRGTTEDSEHRIAFAPMGGGYLELVQPATGPSPARDFLEHRGEGVYHLGYWVDDVAEMLRRAESVGLGAAAVAEDAQGPQIVYLDSTVTFGVHLELVRSAMRPMFEAWVASAQ